MAETPSMASFPEGSRLFVRNLLTDKVSKREVSAIFEKHGPVREVVFRRNFGFVQFETREQADAAKSAESGRLIAGARVEIETADNRGPRREDLDRDRDRYDDRRRRRSPSPGEPRRRPRLEGEYDVHDGRYHVPIDILFCELFCLGLGKSGFPEELEHRISGCGVIVRTHFLERNDPLPPRMNNAKDDKVPFIVTVGRTNEKNKSLSMNVITPTLSDYDVHRSIGVDEMEHLILERVRDICPEALRPPPPPPDYVRPPYPYHDRPPPRGFDRPPYDVDYDNGPRDYPRAPYRDGYPPNPRDAQAPPVGREPYPRSQAPPIGQPPLRGVPPPQLQATRPQPSAGGYAPSAMASGAPQQAPAANVQALTQLLSLVRSVTGNQGQQQPQQQPAPAAALYGQQQAARAPVASLSSSQQANIQALISRLQQQQQPSQNAAAPAPPPGTDPTAWASAQALLQRLGRQ